MKISISELRNLIFEAYFPVFKNEILFEDIEHVLPRTRKWTGKDVHDKVERLIDKASKLRRVASKETKPIKVKLYSRLSDELMDLAEKLSNAYEVSKDPNIILQVYKDAGFDPFRV